MTMPCPVTTTSAQGSVSGCRTISRKRQQEAQLTLEEAAERVRQYVADGQKLTHACKPVAAETGHRKSDLYDAVQKD